ncbi:MAG: sodium-dependent transporter [Planctomycetota bacterium]
MAQRAEWGSKVGFILAASGSAVGLGNIWRFPFTAGDNGGGAFVVLYLICVALVGLPIMMSEIMIGRAAQKQPVAAFHELQGKKSRWAGVGWLGVVAGFIILSFYVVVAGWAMDYTLKSIVNFTGPIAETARANSMAYRTSTPLNEMRLTLIDRELDRQFPNVERKIVSAVKPSTWQMWSETKAVAEASPNEGSAWQMLSEDPERAQAITAGREVQTELDDAKAALRNEIAADIARLTPANVRDRAEDLERRRITRDRTKEVFDAVSGDAWITVMWTAIFMMITMGIVLGGISGGIERACLILMPGLFLLIMVLVVYGMFMPGFGEAVSFVLKPDFTKMQASSVLEAMGQSFFSLSLGMGAMITYGSYQRSKEGLAGQSITIAGLDTGVALLACFMIFPIAFSFGQSPEAGPGLVFMTMPLAFAEIGDAGMLLGAVFFGLLVFAAITSSISLLEVVASYFIDELGWSRRTAVLTIGTLIFLLAIPSAVAEDPVRQIPGWRESYGMGFLDTMNFLASNWMLPLGGFFIAIYAGWFMPKRLRAAEVEGMWPVFFMGWLILVRFVAPTVVILVLLQSIGVLNADELLHGLFN